MLILFYGRYECLSACTLLFMFFPWYSNRCSRRRKWGESNVMILGSKDSIGFPCFSFGCTYGRAKSEWAALKSAKMDNNSTLVAQFYTKFTLKYCYGRCSVPFYVCVCVCVVCVFCWYFPCQENIKPQSPLLNECF